VLSVSQLKVCIPTCRTIFVRGWTGIDRGHDPSRIGPYLSNAKTQCHS